MSFLRFLYGALVSAALCAAGLVAATTFYPLSPDGRASLTPEAAALQTPSAPVAEGNAQGGAPSTEGEADAESGAETGAETGSTPSDPAPSPSTDGGIAPDDAPAAPAASSEPQAPADEAAPAPAPEAPAPRIQGSAPESSAPDDAAQSSARIANGGDADPDRNPAAAPSAPEPAAEIASPSTVAEPETSEAPQAPTSPERNADVAGADSSAPDPVIAGLAPTAPPSETPGAGAAAPNPGASPAPGAAPTESSPADPNADADAAPATTQAPESVAAAAPDPVAEADAPDAANSDTATPAPATPEPSLNAETDTYLPIITGEPTEQTPESGAQTRTAFNLPTTGDDAETITAPEPEAEDAAPPAGAGALLTNAVPFEAPEESPLLAIVLTGVGEAGTVAPETLKDMKIPLTMAVRTSNPAAGEVGAKLRGYGFEVLLQLPMQAKSPVDPGEGALRAEMSDEEVTQAVTAALSRFDGAVGVTNHMGSLVTEDARIMRLLADELKGEGLMLLDARTSRASVAARVAGAAGVPAVENARFVDLNPNVRAIRQALELAAFDARRKGAAVVLAQPRQVTLQAILAWSLERGGRSAVLAPVSAVARRVNGIEGGS